MNIREYFNVLPKIQMDSCEYEFDSLFEATIDKDVDVVYSCDNKIELQKGFGVRSNEFNPTYVNVSFTNVVMSYSDFNACLDEPL